MRTTPTIDTTMQMHLIHLRHPALFAFAHLENNRACRSALLNLGCLCSFAPRSRPGIESRRPPSHFFFRILLGSFICLQPTSPDRRWQTSPSTFGLNLRPSRELSVTFPSRAVNPRWLRQTIHCRNTANQQQNGVSIWLLTATVPTTTPDLCS